MKLSFLFQFVFAICSVTVKSSPSSAVEPTPSESEEWKAKVHLLDRRTELGVQAQLGLGQVEKNKIDLVFIGGSTIQHFEGKEGRSVWKYYYEDRHAVNMGISGDRTQNLIWRIGNGNMKGLNPKLLVVNTGRYKCDLLL